MPVLAVAPETLFQKSGLTLNEGLAFDIWQEIGAALREIDGSIKWWLGDWLCYGERAYGERYAQALEATDYAYQTLKDARYVSSRVEKSLRKDFLSWNHHLAVAPLAPDDQAQWLDRAERDGLSYRALREEIAAARLNETSASLVALTGRYRVLYADPPWHYGNSGLQAYGHAAFHYPSLTTDELCRLPVAGLALDDAVLFLWVTSPMLPDALRLIDAWTFTYKTSFVWDKEEHNHGYYNSVRHEFLLIATRGACLPDTSEKIPSVIRERRARHSMKPERFRQIIEYLYTKGPYVELFARQVVEGWMSWGNEIPSMNGITRNA